MEALQGWDKTSVAGACMSVIALAIVVVWSLVDQISRLHKRVSALEGKVGNSTEPAKPDDGRVWVMSNGSKMAFRDGKGNLASWDAHVIKEEHKCGSCGCTAEAAQKTAGEVRA